MYPAGLIAKWFLRTDKVKYAEEDSDGITNLKLQKLLYYAQGVCLASTGKTLFPESLLAWQHGPVVESVYHEYKAHFANPINLSDTFGLNEEDNESLNRIDEETEDILTSVYNVFGQFSAWKLRDMTHSDTCWSETAYGGEIPLDKIKNTFMEKYVEL